MIVSSLSGGSTSAYMAALLIDKYGKENIKFVFANTGMEHPKTYEFIKNFVDYFKIDLTIVEAVVHHDSRKGCTHKIVDFDTMHIGRSIFEEVIKKYGIPNKAYPHCTRELKNNPVKSWRKAEGLDKLPYAIGIRVDEIDRMAADAEDNNIIYPLISIRPTTKPEIVDWWNNMPFKLELPEHKGNCVTCWKKSQRKLLTLAKHEPELFEDFAYFEEKYANAGHGEEGRQFLSGARFGRDKMTIKDLIHMAQTEYFQEFQPVDPEYQLDLFGMDAPMGGCSESCEAFL